MNDIRSLLRTAGVRLELSAFLHALHRSALIVASAALLLAIVDRLAPAPFVPWSWVGPAFAVLALVIAGGLWSRRRLSEMQVAVAVDARLDLQEKLSTAMHVRARDDAFAQAAVEDAVHTARDPRVREVVGRRFRVQAPERWWISPAVVAFAAIVVLFVPQVTLFADDEPSREERQTARDTVDRTLEAVVKTVQDQDLLKAELGGFVDDLAKQGEMADPAIQPDEMKREALKKVTELTRRLDDIISGEKGRTERSLKEMLGKLRTPDEGPAKALADALAQGDFSEAKKALDKMMEEMQQGEMTPEEKAQLAQQMEQLAQQLQQLAQQQQQLEEALQQAGLNPQLANNPAALQQAIQQAQNLNEQQKQQLQQMMQAQQAARTMCEGLGGACRQMAQGMQSGKPGQGAQKMAGQLNEMEQLQQLLQQAQAASNQCQGQGRGLGQNMAMGGQGKGMGKHGQGSGGTAPIAPTPSGTTLRKADAPIGEGEIIASMLIDGQPIRGESKAKLRRIMEASAEGFDEATIEDPLPRPYHETLQHYFGELKKQVEAVSVTGDDAVAEPDATPAADAPSAP